MELYLKCDVLQLACIFEEFRTVCLHHYALDPSYYVSAPNLAWDSMLKLTNINLELISDQEMFKMIDSALRGGICMITKRYAKANDPLLPTTLYDPSKPTNYIMYLDANNLYGWAMVQPIAFKGFRWMEEAEFSKIDWQVQTPEQATGFYLECDLEYPKEIHDAHNDYPLAPERLVIRQEALSDQQNQIVKCYNIPRSAMTQTKLIPNLMDKTLYTLHYQNLKFYLDHGMKLKKVHRVITYQQSCWLAKYINLNQQLRAAAKNDFEKDFFKLMNNSVYGKTCENLKKRTDIKLVTRKQRKLTNKPQCLAYKIFKENWRQFNSVKRKSSSTSHSMSASQY